MHITQADIDYINASLLHTFGALAVVRTIAGSGFLFDRAVEAEQHLIDLQDRIEAIKNAEAPKVERKR
jgi:ABC-type Fe3+-hydroxamate transport system substrate-binding protein